MPEEKPQKYTVQVAPEAFKQLQKLPPGIQVRILDALKELQNFPAVSNITKLKGGAGWRKRVGDYRIIFNVFENQLLIVVVKIGHRKDVYE